MRANSFGPRSSAIPKQTSNDSRQNCAACAIVLTSPTFPACRAWPFKADFQGASVLIDGEETKKSSRYLKADAN